MSSDIVSHLNLENALTVNKFIFATKDNSSDLNFFFGEILSFYIRQNYSIIIVNLAQSYSHFTHLLMKWSINLRALRDQGKVAVVDLMSEAGSIINANPGDLNIFTSLILESDHTQCLKPLYEYIEREINNMTPSKPNGFVIFIDEINVLKGLGISLKSIQLLIRHLLTTLLTVYPVTYLAGSFLDEFDSENRKVVTYLNKCADINVRVEGLKTGYSKDTHGKITLGIKNRRDCSTKQQTLFFKVGDKGAKLLTLGL